MTEDNELDFRNIGFYIFLVNFLVSLVISIYYLSTLPWNLLWNLLGSLTLIIAGLFIYIIFLNICFLAVVHWVRVDEKMIGNLAVRIMELEERLQKLESK